MGASGRSDDRIRRGPRGSRRLSQLPPRYRRDRGLSRHRPAAHVGASPRPLARLSRQRGLQRPRLAHLRRVARLHPARANAGGDAPGRPRRSDPDGEPGRLWQRYDLLRDGCAGAVAGEGFRASDERPSAGRGRGPGRHRRAASSVAARGPGGLPGPFRRTGRAAGRGQPRRQRYDRHPLGPGGCAQRGPADGGAEGQRQRRPGRPWPLLSIRAGRGPHGHPDLRRLQPNAAGPALAGAPTGCRRPRSEDGPARHRRGGR
jgi:hypothetical protein